jgi:16S rRNA (adenine1518-N6/adenine1519-N6)-dimethyltransferase
VNVRDVLRRTGLAPKKSFGQNFLDAPAVCEAIAAACVHEDEVGQHPVVEWGAGLGSLTEALVPRARRVIAVERDRELVPVLHELFPEAIAAGTLEVIEGDAQAVPLPEERFVLAGNLPYQITGQLLRRATEHRDRLVRAVFMVQLEVADRVCAGPDDDAYGALSVFAQAAFRVTRVRKVPPGAFVPPPRVHSAVIALDARTDDAIEETDAFRKVVSAAFAARRKTLRNAWAGLGPRDLLERMAEAAGTGLDARGEILTAERFAAASRVLADYKPS